MALIDTLNYLIEDYGANLLCIEGEIREATNFEDPDLDWYCDQYDHTKEIINDLQQIKSIIEAQQ
jgi:hypothetical protein